jgi:hypothetical protein
MHMSAMKKRPVRSVRVVVLVTKAEHQQLQAAADAGSLTLSSWLRVVAINAAREQAGPTKKQRTRED